jgi:hypothetical protein
VSIKLQKEKILDNPFTNVGKNKIEERSAVGSTAMISPDFHILFISLSWNLGETKISNYPCSTYTRSNSDD